MHLKEYSSKLFKDHKLSNWHKNGHKAILKSIYYVLQILNYILDEIYKVNNMFIPLVAKQE